MTDHDDDHDDEDFGSKIERLIDEGNEDWEIANAIEEADEVELLVALVRVAREKATKILPADLGRRQDGLCVDCRGPFGRCTCDEDE
jgi:hypothetical protein